MCIYKTEEGKCLRGAMIFSKAMKMSQTTLQGGVQRSNTMNLYYIHPPNTCKYIPLDISNWTLENEWVFSAVCKIIFLNTRKCGKDRGTNRNYSAQPAKERKLNMNTEAILKD